MEHFLDTIETIGEGYGFPLFGARHLITLAVFLAFTAGSCILYGRADKAGRGKMRKLFAILLLADELFKQQEGGENLRRQLKTYLDEATAAKNEVSDLKRQLFKAQQRNNNGK